MPVAIRSSLLLLVLSVLLPGVVGAVWYIAATYDSEREAQERALQDTARALSQVVDGALAERATIARVLSMSRWLDGAPEPSPADLERFAQLARRSMEGHEGWIELHTREARIFDSRRSPAAPPEPWPGGPKALETAAHALPLEDAGRPDVAHAAVVQPVVREGVTVMDLVVTIRPGELQRIIDTQNLPRGWFGVVLDNSGQVIARHPDGPLFLGRPANQDMRERMARGRQGLFNSVSLEGRLTTAYFSMSDRGWTYISAMPRRPAVGMLPMAVAQAGAGALVLLALAVAAALWLSRRIVEPVRALKLAAGRLQVGQPVLASSTGLIECDEVAYALAQAATAVQSYQAELERQVADAVARTRQAEQAASQSQRVEALGRLTGGVAHDFNNLLGVISNSAHLIERHPAAQELAVPLAATRRAVEVGSQLTQHLLRFAGRKPVHPRPLRLGQWLPELQELLHSVLGRRITLVVRVAEELSSVRVDPSELELALLNLALNARDAMPTGGELRVSARHADPEECAGLPGAPRRRYVLLAVTDNGPGIAAPVLARVFEPFFTTKAADGGTGLGLSQVHGFCLQAGGEARIDSSPGLGTTVSLLLPAYDESQAAAAPAALPAAAGGVAGARVLLVEDNPALRDVTAALLSAHGARVERADCAAEALRLLADDAPFDVVLSDVVMPGHMDGIGLARLLRQQQPRLPVVLLSGFSISDANGEFVMLRKPCPQDELLAALAAAIGGRPMAALADQA